MVQGVYSIQDGFFSILHATARFSASVSLSTRSCALCCAGVNAGAGRGMMKAEHVDLFFRGSTFQSYLSYYLLTDLVELLLYLEIGMVWPDWLAGGGERGRSTN